MKVLVTGGAGYVGGVSVDAILAAGHDVVVLDDLSTGHAAIVNPAVRLVAGSYGDGAATRALLEAERVDAILHCAARSLVGESVLDPAKYYRDNVAGGVALLEAARNAGIRRVVFSSTAAVYGSPDSTPIGEDAPLRPINPYGETKRTFEGALHWYGGAYGFRSVILRYFNVAGATERLGEVHRPETHLVPNLLRAAEGGPALTLFGEDYPTPDGTPIRDYLHVADLADAHVAALEATAPDDPRTGPGRRRRTCDPVDLQSRHLERVLRPGRAPGRGGRRRPAHPAHRGSAPGRRPAGAGRLQRAGPRHPGLDPAPLDAPRDDRLRLGLATGPPTRLRGLTPGQTRSRPIFELGADGHHPFAPPASSNVSCKVDTPPSGTGAPSAPGLGIRQPGGDGRSPRSIQMRFGIRVRRERRVRPGTAARGAGQTLVEFALVFPLFMMLMLFIIEFAFVFSALLGVNFASRNAALAAAEAGDDDLADCIILREVEDSIGAPGNKESITTVTIYRSDQSGSARLATLTYTRGGTTTCTKGTTTLSVPYSPPTGTYTNLKRCNVLNGCIIDGVARKIDTIGVEITYQHSWVTPIRNFGLTGTGFTLTQSNAMRMEPIL